MVASVNNVLASDYYNAVHQAISSKECQISEMNIDKGYLAALVENELLDAKNISDDVLEQQKALVDIYVRQLNEAEKRTYATTRKKLRHASLKYGVKSSVDRLLRRWMCSDNKLLRNEATRLNLFLSKDASLIRGLSDL